MLRNDPNYSDRILGLGDDKMANAYLEGDWDLEDGAAFGDLWDAHVHVCSNIEIPRTWTIDRAHDYGYSAPAATLWTAETDGTSAIINDQKVVLPRRSLVIISEQYFADKEDKGLRMLPYELGKRMYEHETYAGLRIRTQAGPADASIFDKDRGMRSIHDDYINQGVRFVKADKRPGSRERGFVVLRQMLKATIERNHEMPWILFHRSCANTISQIPELPTAPDNPQDVNSAANDHIYDALRYRILKSVMRAGTGELLGV
jgi:hypothetical protein